MFNAIAAQPVLAVTLLTLLFLTGGFAGTLAGLFGIGGGIILVPAISTILNQLGVPMEDALHIAVATSLATIIPTSIATLRAHHKRGGIDETILKRWAPMLVIGAALGGVLAQFLHGKILGLAFALLLIFMAWRLTRPQPEEIDHHTAHHRRHPILQRLTALAIGLFSAMLGIGGGVIGVPALCATGLPLKRAIGTASAFGMMVAIPGVGIYLAAEAPEHIPLGGTMGLIHPLALLLLIPGALIGAPYGARLAHRLPVHQLRRGFALLLLLLGAKMLYSSLG